MQLFSFHKAKPTEARGEATALCPAAHLLYLVKMRFNMWEIIQLQPLINELMHKKFRNISIFFDICFSSNDGLNIDEFG